MKIRIISTGTVVEHEFTPEQQRQALRNHAQTLERLEERGGVSWCELTAILLCRHWRKLQADDAELRRYCERHFHIKVTEKS